MRGHVAENLRYTICHPQITTILKVLGLSRRLYYLCWLNMYSIVIIDTDKGFLDQLNKNFRVEQIADRYRLEWVAPDTSLAIPDLIQDCVKAVERSIRELPDVVGVFIDIVIVEGTRDSTGIQIAREIRRLYPQLPLFSITGKYSSDESETILISEASLEDVDGVLVKNYLTGKSFSTSRLSGIFEKAREKRSRYRGSALPSGANVADGINAFLEFDALDAQIDLEIRT